MAIARSKLTSQGQISVPAEVRRKLGVGPGSVLEWDEQGDSIVVRRVGRYTSEDVHRALFPEGPPKTDLLTLKRQFGNTSARNMRAVDTPRLGFSDCLMVELARKAGHLPLGTFDRNVAKLDGVQRL